MRVALDTHVLVWLYEGETKRLSAAAREVLDHAQILIPALVWLELAMIGQKKGVSAEAAAVRHFAEDVLQVHKVPADIADVCKNADTITWTRDPFDRLIVAESLLHGIKLVTKDRLIRKHYAKAVW